MQYRHKVLFLGTILAVSALIYTSSWFFTQERSDLRQSRLTLLAEKDGAVAKRIELTKGSEITVLLKTKANWSVEKDGLSYPAKNDRVSDLLKSLSQTASYPKIASSAKAHANLGLAEDSADRIKVMGDSATYCDLFLGKNDAEGNGRFLRKVDADAAYLGKDNLSYFVSEGPRGWYDLNVFPGTLTADLIQSLSIKADISLEAGTQTNIDYTLRRDAEKIWILQGNESQELDTAKADSLVRAFVAVAGDDFLGEAVASDTAAGATLIAEDGNGRKWTMRLEKAKEGDQINAVVSNQPYRYAFSLWNVKRLLLSEKELFKTVN